MNALEEEKRMIRDDALGWLARHYENDKTEQAELAMQCYDAVIAVLDEEKPEPLINMELFK